MCASSLLSALAALYESSNDGFRRVHEEGNNGIA